MNTATVVAKIEAAEHERDWKTLRVLFADHVVIEHPGVGPVPGADANVAVMQLIIGAIDGYHQSTEGLVIDGERGASRFTITGTHTGELPGFPATGEPIEIGGAMHFELRDGRLAHAVEVINHDSSAASVSADLLRVPIRRYGRGRVVPEWPDRAVPYRRADGPREQRTPDHVVTALFDGVLPADRILAGDARDEYTHDEALGATPVVPIAVLLPETTSEVAAILRVCNEHRIAVTARGSGTGLAGAAIPSAGGVVVSFERMKRTEIDTENQVAIVEPGVTLAELDEVTAKHELVYPVYPGEYSASLGGNVATNAGGMRAVKYGVTRHQVLGLEAVLPSGDVIRTGGRFVKGSTGYDLTQLIVGSEGTLALVTEAILKLYPRPAHQTTVLAPFTTLDGVMHAVPRVVASGIGPLILEYIDSGTLGAMVREFGLELGVPGDVRNATKAYAVVMMENRNEVRLEEDVHELALLLSELGAIDVYVLPSASGQRLIEAREKAFWIAKGAGADDIIDIVVPRASISEYMAHVGEIAQESGAFIAGCGHAGDGNIHLSVYEPDPEERSRVLHALFEAGMAFGGVISGEHGIGTTKRKYFLELEDPVKVDLMRRIKAAFDPNGILNPGTIF